MKLAEVSPELYEKDVTVEEAYEECKKISLSHYENFTVVSRLLPREKKKYIYALYAFSRYTDDLGDELEEGNLEALDRWEEELRRVFQEDKPRNSILVALRDTVESHSLTLEPFRKIIEANRMDQRKKSYQTYEELLHYCDHSANPVGRIFLAIFGYNDIKRKELSDKTCTGLQLTNFWQDVDRDEKIGRVYLPVEDMKRFDYSREKLENRIYNEEFVKLMEFEVERARGLLTEGMNLVPLLDKRIRMDVRLFNEGGLRVLDKIEWEDYDVLHKRPTLSKGEKVWLFLSNLLKWPVRGLAREEPA
ncbi:squalene synthase HpnC [Candidatus Bipolaricaulota bacterium]|nr:squalene synthase HpnC [Candidatus Bipolaricaulota bacterium]MBS3814117.1 squalene synthase HpnC [Candidatus Bipolaricaulota bacterium]MBS3825765.1 squalene synthase HpnC [Candidatus Bipolaricaulota bacterium]